jgi:hypothetical protein
VKWDIRDQLVAQVFDTTASNSSGEVGACFYLEMWLDRPILWTACRHHIYELHVNWVVKAIWGSTKEPGVSLFRRLKSSWYDILIDLENLEKFDYSAVPKWMAEEARSVLKWAEEELRTTGSSWS